MSGNFMRGARTKVMNGLHQAIWKWLNLSVLAAPSVQNVYNMGLIQERDADSSQTMLTKRDALYQGKRLR